ncbi:hypothetical protein B296_00004568 [Ensete ventricosum]|uniref:Uncharacterized protein n=1 Tax=Ensete ventricosum TaxID=4639 RepID=A0A427AZJ9_ENSVE|nr:hypothetical protein B296_00004568 [Ensete ventricosum]
MFSGLIHRSEASIPPEEARGPSLVLTADPKPRLRWTADLHDRFVDAVAQLGGPESSYLLLLVSSIEAIPASLAIKYRLGKQSGKELTEQSKDDSSIMHVRLHAVTHLLVTHLLAPSTLSLFLYKPLTMLSIRPRFDAISSLS